jgi:hypothetical protein
LVAAAWHDQAQQRVHQHLRREGYKSYEQLLHDEAVDIVFAAPVSELRDPRFGRACRQAHGPRKPMAMTLRRPMDGERCRASGVSRLPFRASCGCRPPTQGAWTQELGDLLVVHQTSRWSIAEDAFNSGTPGWFVDPKHVPGGAFIDEGIYSIDYLAWIAGSDVVEVDARMANLVHKEIEVEDWGFATLTLANGMIGTLRRRTINAPRKTAPSPKQRVVRTEWSAAVGKSSTSGSASLAAPCSRPARTTGCSSGTPVPRTDRRCRFR